MIKPLPPSRPRMRRALLCVLLSGCFTVSSATITPKPALEVDGKGRAIWISLDRSISDVQVLYDDRFQADEWRRIVGQAFTDGLRETFVVVNLRRQDVLELHIKRAEPRFVPIGRQVWAQVDFQATLEDGQGRVLARAAEVVTGPVPSSDLAHVDLTITSAVEELVRRGASKLVPSIPDTFPARTESSLVVWMDSAVASEPAASRPRATPKPRRCVAEKLPEWATASAAEKKTLLERCN